jgi:adenylate cyclase
VKAGFTGPGRFATAVLVGVLVAAMRFAGCAYLDALDVRATDFRFGIRGPIKPTGAVVLVAIDEKSLAEVGRWPWSRGVMAELLKRLASYEPIVVGLDVVFAEPSDLSAFDNPPRPEGLGEVHWAQAVQALRAHADVDATMARAAAASGNIVLGYFYDYELAPASGQAPARPYNLVRPSPSGRGEDAIPLVGFERGNLDLFNAVGADAGYFNMIPDPADGAVRSIPLALRGENSYAVPLPLAMLRSALGLPLKLTIEDFGAASIAVGRDIEIPVAEDAMMRLNYRGPRGTIGTVSAADVLFGRADPALLAGKLAIVGATAVGAGDVRVTPVDPFYPGPEIHATALDTILAGDFLVEAKWLVLVEIGAILFLAVFLGLVLPRIGPVAGGFVVTLAGGGWLFVAQRVFEDQGYMLSATYPILAVVGCYIAVTVRGFLSEQADKARIRRAFGSYMAPELVELVSADPERLKLGGEKRELSILFSDIRGFTTISEQFDPEGLTKLMNRFLTPMTHEILSRRGTVDKYIGDAIMAFWNAPLDVADHPREACGAALAMTRLLGPLNLELEAEAQAEGRKHIELRAGIGINTGPAVVGNMGSEIRFDYSLLGDSVNLAARCESITKQYGVSILVTESAWEEVRDFALLEADLVRVKGKTKPVRIFTLVGEPEIAVTPGFENLAALHEAMLVAYRDRRFEDAISLAEKAQGCIPEGLALDSLHGLNFFYELYVDRAKGFIAEPPPEDWDGVFIAESK